ncbi:MAG: NAD(P)/FAD-dependent oxidoreductase [Pseudomonadota bacterium]
MAEKHHVVVVGGGFGGLSCVNEIRGKRNVRVTLIDQKNHHLFQPLLYQVATTILPTSDVAWPLRRLVRKCRNVTTLMAEVSGVDKDAKTVSLSNGETISFDSLVLATGARHSYFGNEHWEEHAPGLKTLEDAIKIRRRILSAFEKAELATTEEERKAHQTFAIIGAGPTGVELAGIIAELAHSVLPKEFRRIDTRRTRVLLIEGSDRILRALPEDLSDYAAKALEKLGVEILTDHRVTDITADGVQANDKFIRSHTAIWAAGVRASKAAEWLDMEADRAGRAVVTPQLNIPEHENIFVIGDTASVMDKDDNPVPGIAPAAKQQGKYVGKAIKRMLKRKTLKPFKYKHAGNLATIGPSEAVIDFGWTKLRGTIGWWVWGLAHIYFLIGNRSKIGVSISWIWAYFTGQRSARLITQVPKD